MLCIPPSTKPTKLKSSETTEVRRSKNCVDWSVLKNFHVISIMLLAVGYKFTTSNFYAYCGALVQQIGHTAHEASYLLSLSGMADIFGNIIYGVLFDLPFVKKRNMTLLLHSTFTVWNNSGYHSTLEGIFIFMCGIWNVGIGDSLFWYQRRHSE